MSDQLYRIDPIAHPQWVKVLIDVGVLALAEPNYDAAALYARDVEGIYISADDVAGIVKTAYKAPEPWTDE